MEPPTDHDVAGRTVLVTGGAGFIGSHIVESLAEDNDVRVLDDLSTGTREHVPEGAELIVGDLTDRDRLSAAMDGVDLVFHQAAQVDAARSVEEPEETHDVNVGGTLKLLEAAKAVGARVVVASSAAIYGQPEYVPVDEDHPKTPTNPYGATKLSTDHYARLYADLYDVPTVALRYFNVYGPRQVGGDYSAVISAFVRQARSGDPITVHGDGEQTRDFVHVRDVVQANLLAATTEHVGESFNVGTGDRISIRELAELVKEMTGSDSPIVHTEARTGDVEHSGAHVEAARTRLGHEAEISLREGLRTVPGLE